MTDASSFEWKKYLTECVEATEYCALGTVDENGVWVNPVWFAVDDSFNVYFISKPDSRHMKNIEKDKSVSIAIYRTNYGYTDDKIGIQLQGDAVILSDTDVDEAYDIYYGRKYPDIRKNKRGKEVDDYKGKNAEWKFVKITPTNLYYFDMRFFDEERQTVPLGQLTA